MASAPLSLEQRASLARYGKLLGWLTIVWSSAEAILSLWSSARTGSISLAGFGYDSVIEVLSALAVSWRMHHEMDHARRHHAERVSLKISGYCLIAVAVYVLVDACVRLARHQGAEVGALGASVMVAALVCMPLLAQQKRRVGHALSSGAMVTDAKQTDFCMYQAAIVLLGMVCHRFFGVTWADGAAALVLVPILLRAGILALRGEQCCTHH